MNPLMPKSFRPATDAEIIEAKAHDIRNGRPVRYRHFVKEYPHHLSRNGVAHWDHSYSKLRVINGVPHVIYNGNLEPVTASVAEVDADKLMVFDLRIKLECLP